MTKSTRKMMKRIRYERQCGVQRIVGHTGQLCEAEGAGMVEQLETEEIVMVETDMETGGAVKEFVGVGQSVQVLEGLVGVDVLPLLVLLEDPEVLPLLVSLADELLPLLLED